MKIAASTSHVTGSRRKTGGFTLVEMLFAVAIMIIVIGAILDTNLLGLRMMQVNETKLAPVDWSRNVFDRMTEEVRSCDQEVYIGNTLSNNFEGILSGEPQVGNALLISNSSSYILYFYNSADNSFHRITSSDSTGLILAQSMTNSLPFTGLDIYGNILTNNTGNRLIHVALDIYQPGYYLSPPNYYQLETSITQRAP